ncbi:MAG TPA: hypothetical protein VN462_04270 [Negativicutes bacterium]|nr:hypothetical protein [Negativicutes bacterium]
MSDEETSSANERTARGILFQERGLLSEFQFIVLTPNTTDSIVPPITLTVSTPPFTLAELPPLHIDDVTDRVWLSATVTFAAAAADTTVEYRIYRDLPITGPLIFNALDFQATTAAFSTTSFSHVDFPVITEPGQQEVHYFLVAVVLGGTANFSGPLTFTGAEIERNRICDT